MSLGPSLTNKPELMRSGGRAFTAIGHQLIIRAHNPVISQAGRDGRAGNRGPAASKRQQQSAP
eukprot:3603161-Prymnesium_polylepis.6